MKKRQASPMHPSRPAPYGRSDAPRTASMPPVNRNIMRHSTFEGKLHRGHVEDQQSYDVCKVKRECGSCIYVNTDYAKSLRRKFDDGLAILRDAKVLDGTQVLDPVPSPHALGYRTLFKLAVRQASPAQKRAAEDNGQSRRFAIGLFEPGTHRVSVDMKSCPVHVQPLTWLLTDLESELELSPLTPWDEKTANGDLRYIVARSAHLTGEIMLTFVVTTAVKPDLVRLTNKLRRMGHKINCTYMNINTSSGNAIFGPTTTHVSGNLALRERICDLDLEISPLAFFQINPWQATNLYRRVEMHAGTAKPNGIAWDLYTGTGQMALLLARAGYRTIGIEEIVAATEDAKRNAQKNQLTSKLEFIAARVEDSETKVPAWGQNPSVIVVNPSRRGLHETARSHLTHVLRANSETKFIYVSCEAATLARDLAKLCESGHRVRQIEAFDMFAQTDKLEWIAVLTK